MSKTSEVLNLPHIALQDYKVFIASLNQWQKVDFDLSKYSSFHIFVDSNTNNKCLPVFKTSQAFAALTGTDKPIQVIEMKAGESFKNIETCKVVWAKLMEQGADRKSLMINLGGGVVGDLGGFCASTFMRGMDFIQIPTTLLAMADASVGGKTGIDFQNVKNYVGLFCMPKMVWVDPVFLQTLSERQLINGMAEVIKHAFIADKNLFEDLENQKWTIDALDWAEVLYRSIQIKADIVEADLFEHGERKKLNFGHTVGHAIETYALESGVDMLHGEAIVIGMLAESYISTKLSRLPQDHLALIESILMDHYAHFDISSFPFEKIQSLLMHDKKKEGKNVGFTLLDKLGSSVIARNVSVELLKESLIYYKEL